MVVRDVVIATAVATVTGEISVKERRQAGRHSFLLSLLLPARLPQCVTHFEARVFS